MTKEALQERMTQYDKDLEALRNQYITIEGAKQDCQYWMDELAKEVPKETPVEAPAQEVLTT